MRSFLFLLIHFLTTLAKLLGPGGIKSVLAENLFIKQQLLVMNRFRVPGELQITPPPAFEITRDSVTAR